MLYQSLEALRVAKQLGISEADPSFASVHDAVDDLATEDDPYEDQIPLADWEALRVAKQLRLRA